MPVTISLSRFTLSSLCSWSCALSCLISPAGHRAQTGSLGRDSSGARDSAPGLTVGKRLVLPFPGDARHGDGILTIFVGHHWRGGAHRELVHIGGELVLAVEYVFESNLLAGVGGHAAHARDKAAFRAAFGLVVRLVVADGVQQIVPLVYIGILLARWDIGGPNHVRALRILALEGHGRGSAVACLGGDSQAFAAMHIAGVDVVASVHASAIHNELGAVGK